MNSERIYRSEESRKEQILMLLEEIREIIQELRKSGVEEAKLDIR